MLTGIAIEGGNASYVGDGLWAIDQTDEGQRGAGRHQRVVMAESDLAALAGTLPASLEIELEDGVALYVGDGLWAIDQIDETLPVSRGDGQGQRVILSGEEAARMLEAAQPCRESAH